MDCLSDGKLNKSDRTKIIRCVNKHRRKTWIIVRLEPRDRHKGRYDSINENTSSGKLKSRTRGVFCSITIIIILIITVCISVDMNVTNKRYTNKTHDYSTHSETRNKNCNTQLALLGRNNLKRLLALANMTLIES